MNKKSKPVCLFAALMVTAFSSSIALADYEIRVGARHNDNIFRTSNQKQDDTVASIGLLLDSEYESSRIESNIVSDLEYWHYTDDTFDDEFVGNLVADLTIELAPNVMDWIIQDNFGAIQIDPFQPVTGGNRETLNSLSTGPDFSIKLGNATAAELSARYSTRNYEITDSDSEVLGGHFALVRALNPNRSISVNYSENQVQFDNTVDNTDFDKRSVYLSFNSIVSRSTIDIYAGWSEIDRLGITSDSPLWGIDLSRKLTSRTTLEIGASQQFSDAASGFRAFQSIAASTGGTTPTTGIADPYESKSFYATLRTETRKSTLGFSVVMNDEDFLTSSAFDSRTHQAIFTLGRELGSAWELGFLASYERADFRGIGREDDDLGFAASLSRKLSQQLTLNFSYGHSNRDSTLVGGEYDENVASVFVSYRRKH